MLPLHGVGLLKGSALSHTDLVPRARNESLKLTRGFGHLGSRNFLHLLWPGLCHPAHVSEKHLELHVPACNPCVAASAQLSAAACLPCQVQKHLYKPGLSSRDLSVIVFISRKSHRADTATESGTNVTRSCSSVPAEESLNSFFSPGKTLLC